MLLYVLIMLVAMIPTTETKSYVVTDCVKVNDIYEVTIEDNEGNEWAYYDDCYLCDGHLIRPIFNGNEEIIDVEY